MADIINEAIDPGLTYDQYQPAAQVSLIPAQLTSSAITDFNGLSGPSISLGGGTTGYSFSVASPNITMTVTPATVRGALLIKSQRVTTGSVPASSTVDVTLTWTAAFADTSYTAVAQVLEASVNLEVVAIKSQAAGNIVVTVKNNDAGGAHTGTLHGIAIHD